MDAQWPTVPFPPAVNGTYALLSASPFSDYESGQTATANSAVYQAPSGAWVFGAGTISWSWALDGTYTVYNWMKPGFEDARIQRATANLFKRFGISVP